MGYYQLNGATLKSKKNKTKQRIDEDDRTDKLFIYSPGDYLAQ